MLDNVGKMLCQYCSGVHCVVYYECASITSKVGVGGVNRLYDKVGLDMFFARRGREGLSSFCLACLLPLSSEYSCYSRRIL